MKGIKLMLMGIVFLILGCTSIILKADTDLSIALGIGYTFFLSLGLFRKN